MATVTGTITHTNYLGATYYGNPMYEVFLDSDIDGESGWYRITNNSMLNYAINNSEFKSFTHTFTLTAAGRLRGSYNRV